MCVHVDSGAFTSRIRPVVDQPVESQTLLGRVCVINGYLRVEWPKQVIPGGK